MDGNISNRLHQQFFHPLVVMVMHPRVRMVKILNMQDKDNVSEKDTTLLWYNETGEHDTPIPEKYMKEEFCSELPYM